MSQPYKGPAVLLMSDAEWFAIYRHLLHVNTTEGAALKAKIRAYLECERGLDLDYGLHLSTERQAQELT